MERLEGGWVVRQRRVLLPLFRAMVRHGKKEAGGGAAGLLVAQPARLGHAAGLLAAPARFGVHLRLRLYLDSLHSQLGDPPAAQGRALGLRGLRQKNSAAVELLSELRRESVWRGKVNGYLLLRRVGGNLIQAVLVRDRREVRVGFGVIAQLVDEVVHLRTGGLLVIGEDAPGLLAQAAEVSPGVMHLAPEENVERAADDHQRDEEHKQGFAQGGHLLPEVAGVRGRGKGIEIFHNRDWDCYFSFGLFPGGLGGGGRRLQAGRDEQWVNSRVSLAVFQRVVDQRADCRPAGVDEHHLHLQIAQFLRVYSVNVGEQDGHHGAEGQHAHQQGG